MIHQLPDELVINVFSYAHQFRYKSQWTLGCVGRIIPPVKGSWPAAKF